MDIEDNNSKIKLTDLKGDYEFKDVYFSYEDDQPLLSRHEPQGERR